MESHWTEIKRLASDFKNVQLKSEFQNLSEGNCVEIVSLLVKSGLVNIYFTNDGKEYVTHAGLQREILAELDLNDGRVNTVDISNALHIDITKVESIVNEIIYINNNIYFVVGQLIGENYIHRLAQEINQIVMKHGEVNTSDLAIQFDLPMPFLQLVIVKYLGNVIRCRQNSENSGTLFTQAYTENCKLKAIGAMSGVTRPTAICSILSRIKVQEKLFHLVFGDALYGYISSKHSNAIYIPNMFKDEQAEWVISFYKQNGFVEYSAAAKIGISNIKQFIKKCVPEGDIIFLKKIALNQKIIDLTLLTAINECIDTKSYVDVSTILPQNMSCEDIGEVMELITASSRFSNEIVYFPTTVFSKVFLNHILLPCYEMAETNAKVSVQNGFYKQYITDNLFESNKSDKKDIMDIKVNKKVHGNVQEKDIKSKRGKKRYGSKCINEKAREDVIIEKKTKKCLELVKTKDIENILFKILNKEGIDQFADDIAILYQSDINKKAMEIAQKFYESTVHVSRRQNHILLEEKYNITLNYIRLYENGIKLFSPELQSQLENYFFKSLGNDICNELTTYLANQCNMKINPSNNFNAEQRNKIAQDCLPIYKSAILEFNAANKTMHEFYIAIETAIKSCDMFVKKSDKKQDRALILQHTEKLRKELSESREHALVLHLTVLILFIKTTGNILHASGRFVSNVLTFLTPYLQPDENNLLSRYHDLVLKSLQLDSSSLEFNEINEKLISLQFSIKQLVMNDETALILI